MKKFKRDENLLEILSIRMSKDLKREMERMGKRQDRNLSEQIDHMLSLGQMLIHFCDGRDNLEIVEKYLKSLKRGNSSRSTRETFLRSTF